MVGEMEVDMVADMEVDMVADMEVDLGSDMEVDKVADIEVDNVAVEVTDMVVDMDVATAITIGDSPSFFEPKFFSSRSFPNPNFFKLKLTRPCTSSKLCEFIWKVSHSPIELSSESVWTAKMYGNTSQSDQLPQVAPEDINFDTFCANCGTRRLENLKVLPLQ